MEVIQEFEMSSEGFSEEGASGRREHVINGFRPASLQVLDHVKINMEAETPRSTVKEVLKISSRSNLSFSKHELRKAEELMTQAFSEFYQKLKLLKSFSFLNQLAFSKIMKKYDKCLDENERGEFLNEKTEGQENSSASLKSDNTKREKFLWLLTQNFIKLFLCSDVNLITLESAVVALLGDSHNSTAMKRKHCFFLTL